MREKENGHGDLRRAVLCVPYIGRPAPSPKGLPDRNSSRKPPSYPLFTRIPCLADFDNTHSARVSTDRAEAQFRAGRRQRRPLERTAEGPEQDDRTRWGRIGGGQNQTPIVCARQPVQSAGAPCSPPPPISSPLAFPPPGPLLRIAQQIWVSYFSYACCVLGPLPLSLPMRQGRPTIASAIPGRPGRGVSGELKGRVLASRAGICFRTSTRSRTP